MPTVSFSHPLIKNTLTIDTGMSDVTWAYNLVTQAYPTFDGEVLQVLACNIDNVTVTGEVRSYRKMESIYRWFLEYFNLATQGFKGPESGYTERPVTMLYPHRGWTMKIKPISLPQMTYGRDVQIPTWALVAAVHDPDPEQVDLAIDNGVHSIVGGAISNFKGTFNGGIGYRQANPFSDPLAVLTKDEATLYPDWKKAGGLKVEGDKTDDDTLKNQLSKDGQGIAKHLAKMHEAMASGNFDFTDSEWLQASAPATSKKKTAKTQQTKDGKT